MTTWRVAMVTLGLLAALGATGSGRAAEVTTLLGASDVVTVLGPWDDGLLTLTGEPVRVGGETVSGYRLAWIGPAGVRVPILEDLDLLAADRSSRGELALVTIDGELLVGEPDSLDTIAQGDRFVTQARWAPEGDRIAVTAWTGGSRPDDRYRARTTDELRAALDNDVAVLDRATGCWTRLTDSPRQDYNPVWSPDGEQVLFVSTRTGYASFFVVDASSGIERQLSNHGVWEGESPVPVALSGLVWWDAASDLVVYETRDRHGAPEVWSLSPSGSAWYEGPYHLVLVDGGVAWLRDGQALLEWDLGPHGGGAR